MAPAPLEDDVHVAGDIAHPPPGENAGPTPVIQTLRRRQPCGGPVDIERQCGVSLGEGRRCGAALACRRHSTGAKRAVAGRSAPFDQLLAASPEHRV